MTDGGYTPAEIREMTLDEANRLFAFWERRPPLRVLVSAFVGATDTAPAEPPRPTLEEFAAAARKSGGKIVGGRSDR